MELPSVKKRISDAIKSKDLLILAFTPSDNKEKLIKFVNNEGIKFSMFTNSYEVFKKYNAMYMPYTVIVDKKGLIRYSQSSMLDEERLSLLKKLISE
jgi:hypothetical protein